MWFLGACRLIRREIVCACSSVDTLRSSRLLVRFGELV